MSDFETSNKDSVQKALEQTKPQADFAFRENLEAQLMAQLTSSEQVSGGNTMNLFKREKHKRKTQSARVPLTLAAAIVAIALVGGLLIFIQQADLPNMSMSDSACGYDGATQTILLQEGDTLFSLAEQYEVDINELLEANCFEDQLVMSVGDEVLIPVSARGIIPNPVTVFVATADIVAGETITMEKVTSEPRMPDRVDGENPVNAIESLLGQTALVSIEAGTIIDSHMITAGQRTLMTPVVIAITDMVAGDEITADDVEVVMYPEQSTPGSTFSEVDDVIGSYATTDIFTHELISEAKVSSEPVDNQANFTSRRIGIVRGNIDVTENEICEDGLSPATITDDLAELTAGAMQRSGYLVEVFNADERALSGYEADFIIELYTGGCNEDAGNGYSGAWYSDTQYLSEDEQFEACMTEHYEPVTGIPSGNYPTSALPSSGTPLLGVGQSVPSVRLYLGSLAYNREALVDNAEMLHSGLVFTLRCMMPIETLDQVPVVVARYDLPLSHVITEEDIVTMMIPRDFAEELVTQSDNGFAQNLGDSGLIGVEEQVVGQVTTTYIPQFEPILSGDILDANQCATNPNDEIRCRILEEDKVAVTLPIEDRSVMLLVEGQQVDVITATLSANAGSISSQPTLLTLVSDAKILMIDGEGDGISVTIEVEPQIAEQLIYFIESQHDLQIVPHIENSEAFNDQDIAIYPLCRFAQAELQHQPDHRLS
ncbi:MAG: SAF domain-containing protein, partial [Chloroflexota bacterium]